MISPLVPFVLNGPFSAPEQSSASYDCFNSLAFVIYMHNHFYLSEFFFTKINTLSHAFSFTKSYRNKNVIQFQVSAMIGNIRNMSNDMNTALHRQNQTLDRINAKANSDITRVKMANERAAALMK